MSGVDWEQLPEEVYAAYRKRLQIVELILDDSIDPASKRKLREQFLAESALSLRTLQNWLARYLKHGPAGLLFRRPRRARSPRLHEEKLRRKILQLVNEAPGRSVPKLRHLLAVDPDYAALIGAVSDRTLYRFLQDYAERKQMPKFAGISFERKEMTTGNLGIISGALQTTELFEALLILPSRALPR
jgi:hypothetical protein